MDLVVRGVPPVEGTGTSAVHGIRGYGVDLLFDPSVIRLDRIWGFEGPTILAALPGAAGGTFEASSFAGMIRIDGADFQHNIEDGDGVLTRITMEAIGAGNSNLFLETRTYEAVIDSANKEYFVRELQSGQVAVERPCSTNIPKEQAEVWASSATVFGNGTGRIDVFVNGGRKGVTRWDVSYRQQALPLNTLTLLSCEGRVLCSISNNNRASFSGTSAIPIFGPIKVGTIYFKVGPVVTLIPLYGSGSIFPGYGNFPPDIQHTSITVLRTTRTPRGMTPDPNASPTPTPTPTATPVPTVEISPILTEPPSTADPQTPTPTRHPTRTPRR